MAKHLVRNYVFNPGARTVTFSRPDFDQVELGRLYLVTDVTTGAVLYQFNGADATVSGNVLTLASVPGGCQSTDTLQIIYDFPLPDSGRLITPDTPVLCDDIFDSGPCGWQELFAFPAADWNTSQAMPLTLSPHGNFGRYALRLTTANVPSACYGGQATAIKRLTHQAQPGVAAKGVIKSEFWWTFGSDGNTTTNNTGVTAATYSAGPAPYTVTVTVASAAGLSAGSVITVSGLGGLTNCGGAAVVSAVSGSNVTYTIAATPSGTYTSGGTVSWNYDSAAPRSITFNLDTEADTNTAVSNGAAGARAFFGATWQQSTQNSSVQNYTGQWYFNRGSGVAYGTSGYLMPTSTALVASGYYTNFPANQNKRSQQYSAFIMDTANGLWLGMQANDIYYDLTSIPGLSGGSLATVLAPNDPQYNANDFVGGVNPYVTVNNLLAGGLGTTFGTAAWLELHRVRVSYL